MKSRIISALVDTLVNSMETFMDSNDFEEYLNDEYDIDSSVAKKMFADYWKISANDRFEWDYLEWSRWLKGYGIRESVMKIEKRKEIVEIQEEVRIPQGDHELILEKGDKIEILKEKSKAYQKYLDFVDKKGHITPSASSVFKAWINNEGSSLSLDDIKNALDDLWPSTDSESKYNLIDYAIRRGIK